MRGTLYTIEYIAVLAKTIIENMMAGTSPKQIAGSFFFSMALYFMPL